MAAVDELKESSAERAMAATSGEEAGSIPADPEAALLCWWLSARAKSGEASFHPAKGSTDRESSPSAACRADSGMAEMGSPSPPLRPKVALATDASLKDDDDVSIGVDNGDGDPVDSGESEVSDVLEIPEACDPDDLADWVTAASDDEGISTIDRRRRFINSETLGALKPTEEFTSTSVVLSTIPVAALEAAAGAERVDRRIVGSRTMLLLGASDWAGWRASDTGGLEAGVEVCRLMTDALKAAMAGPALGRTIRLAPMSGETVDSDRWSDEPTRPVVGDATVVDEEVSVFGGESSDTELTICEICETPDPWFVDSSKLEGAISLW
jgi:hypothetical protein